MIQGKWTEVWTKLSKMSENDTIKIPFKWNLCIFQFKLKEVGTSNPKFFLKYIKSLQEVLQATLELANTNMQKS